MQIIVDKWITAVRCLDFCHLFLEAYLLSGKAQRNHGRPHFSPSVKNANADYLIFQVNVDFFLRHSMSLTCSNNPELLGNFQQGNDAEGHFFFLEIIFFCFFYIQLHFIFWKNKMQLFYCIAHICLTPKSPHCSLEARLPSFWNISDKPKCSRHIRVVNMFF